MTGFNTTDSSHCSAASKSSADQITAADKQGSGSLADSDWASGVHSYTALDHESPPHRTTTWGQLLPATVAALLLITQVGWFNRALLWDHPDGFSALTKICTVIPCSEPEVILREPLITSNLIVRSHPLRNNALQVDFILRNTTQEPQPLPDLAMRFSNTQGRVVAQRVFTGTDYLSGELAGESMIPPDYDIHIALNFADPGPLAQRYQMDLIKLVDN
ncbi:MAG: hypothetical protein ACI9GW_000528 [Halieaceae bacterium]